MATTKSIEEIFAQKVWTNKRIYKSKNLLLLAHLERVKKETAEANKDIEPYISNEKYRCETCGTKDRHHPVTGYCFICDTDNWTHAIMY